MWTRDPVCVCQGTFNGNSAVERRRFPCDHGAVLANRCALDVLRGVGHIWVQQQLEKTSLSVGKQCSDLEDSDFWLRFNHHLACFHTAEMFFQHSKRFTVLPRSEMKDFCVLLSCVYCFEARFLVFDFSYHCLVQTSDSSTTLKLA